MIETAPAPTAPSTGTPVAADPSEAQLVNQVGTLWQVHSQAQSSLTKSRAEMKVIRGDLSRRLTEHANLRDQWFQDALVEQPWTKPPALVPESWPNK